MGVDPKWLPDKALHHWAQNGWVFDAAARGHQEVSGDSSDQTLLGSQLPWTKTHWFHSPFVLFFNLEYLMDGEISQKTECIWMWKFKILIFQVNDSLRRLLHISLAPHPGCWAPGAGVKSFVTFTSPGNRFLLSFLSVSMEQLGEQNATARTFREPI